MLVGTLGASFLGGKGAIAKRQGRGIYRAREGVIRAGYGNKRQNYEKKRIFNAASSFHWFWDPKVLLQWIQI